MSLQRFDEYRENQVLMLQRRMDEAIVAVLRNPKKHSAPVINQTIETIQQDYNQRLLQAEAFMQGTMDFYGLGTRENVREASPENFEKALSEAKKGFEELAKPNCNVSVPLNLGKTPKRGFFGKMWDGFKNFVSENIVPTMLLAASVIVFAVSVFIPPLLPVAGLLAYTAMHVTEQSAEPAPLISLRDNGKEGPFSLSPQNLDNMKTNVERKMKEEAKTEATAQVKAEPPKAQTKQVDTSYATFESAMTLASATLSGAATSITKAATGIAQSAGLVGMGTDEPEISKKNTRKLH